MRKRVPDEVLVEIVDNGGCRKGSVEPVSAMGVQRLALDLIDARAEAANLQSLLERALAVAEPLLGIK